MAARVGRIGLCGRNGLLKSRTQGTSADVPVEIACGPTPTRAVRLRRVVLVSTILARYPTTCATAGLIFINH